MHKRLILILLFLSPLLNSILTSTAVESSWGESFAQIVIKDEIVLDEDDSPDAETLTMPFYGKVTGCVNSYCYDWCGLKLVTIEANGQIVEKGWYSCGGGWVYCPWGILNLPAGTPVEIKVYTCVNNVFTEAQTVLQTGTNQYKVRFYSGTHQDWYDATTIEFTATTPPGCANAQNQYCSSTTFHTPNIYFVLEEEGYADPRSPCNERSVGRLTGDYIPEHSQRLHNRHLFNENSLDACFNKDTQKWQFNFFSPSDFEVHLMLDYCEENMAQYFVLKDIDDVGEIFDCYFAEICFNKHKYQYGWSGMLYPGCYLIKEVITLHEQLHFTQRINDLIELKEKYDMNIELWEQDNSDCNSFLNPTVAKQKALKFVKNQFTELMKEMQNRVKNYKDTGEEIYVRSSAFINEMVDDYLDALYNHCYN